jgi:hypothetical protein
MTPTSEIDPWLAMTNVAEWRRHTRDRRRRRRPPDCRTPALVWFVLTAGFASVDLANFANGRVIGHIGIDAFGLFIAIAVQEAQSLPNRMAPPIVDHGSTIHERQIDHLYLAVSQDVIAIDFADCTVAPLDLAFHHWHLIIGTSSLHLFGIFDVFHLLRHLFDRAGR